MDNFDFLVNSIDCDILEKEGKILTKGETKYYDKITSEYFAEIILIEKKEGKEKDIEFKEYIVEVKINDLTYGKEFKRLYKIIKSTYEDGREGILCKRIEKSSEKSLKKSILWAILFITLLMILLYYLIKIIFI